MLDPHLGGITRITHNNKEDDHALLVSQPRGFWISGRGIPQISG